MSPDDLPVPTDDAIARAARHALGTLSDADAFGDHSWSSVQTGARRLRQRRTSVAGAACALVLVGAGAAVAMTSHDDRGRLRVAGTTSTIAPTDESTIAAGPRTSTPETYDSSSAPPRGSTTTVTLPSEAPQAGDVTGTLDLVGFGRDDTTGVKFVPVGAHDEIRMSIRNTSVRTIWSSNASLPTALAMICTTESADPSRSLWWMNNISLAPGETETRFAPFTPTAAYVGSVQCELDVVAPTDGGTSFDMSAGGDAASGTIVAPVTGVPSITFLVHAHAGTAKGPISKPPSAMTATTVP